MEKIIDKVALAIGHRVDCPVLNNPNEPPYVEPGPCACSSRIRALTALKVSHHDELVGILKVAIKSSYRKSFHGEPEWCATARKVLEKVGTLP